MPIYRTHSTTKEGESLGFQYWGTRVEAERAAESPGVEFYDVFDAVPTPRTKKAVLALLNRWADHPDNG